MVMVSGTQALFQEPSSESEGPTSRNNSFLTTPPLILAGKPAGGQQWPPVSPQQGA